MGEAKKSKNKKTSAFGKFYQFPHLFLLFEDTDSPIMLLNFLVLLYSVVAEETNHSNSYYILARFAFQLAPPHLTLSNSCYKRSTHCFLSSISTLQQFLGVLFNRLTFFRFFLTPFELDHSLSDPQT